MVNECSDTISILNPHKRLTIHVILLPNRSTHPINGARRFLEFFKDEILYIFALDL
jgi:hypothetical protein